MVDPKKIKLTHSEDYYIRKLLTEVKVKEIMTSPAISLHVREPFSKVAEILINKRIRHLPIVDDRGHVVGLMTQRQLYKVQSPHKVAEGEWVYDPESLNTIILANVMKQDPMVIHPHETAASALLKIVDHGYGSLPVVESTGILCGIVTRADILAIAAQILREK